MIKPKPQTKEGIETDLYLWNIEKVGQVAYSVTNQHGKPVYVGMYLDAVLICFFAFPKSRIAGRIMKGKGATL